MRLTELHADLQALRENLADELLAINRYEEQAFSLSDEEAKEHVQRIVDEKKEHVARLLRVIQRLDDLLTPHGGRVETALVYPQGHTGGPQLSG